jgi:hypothetical protein
MKDLLTIRVCAITAQAAHGGQYTDARIIDKIAIIPIIPE